MPLGRRVAAPLRGAAIPRHRPVPSRPSAGAGQARGSQPRAPGRARAPPVPPAPRRGAAAPGAGRPAPSRRDRAPTRGTGGSSQRPSHRGADHPMRARARAPPVALAAPRRRGRRTRSHRAPCNRPRRSPPGCACRRRHREQRRSLTRPSSCRNRRRAWCLRLYPPSSRSLIGWPLHRSHHRDQSVRPASSPRRTSAGGLASCRSVDGAPEARFGEKVTATASEPTLLAPGAEIAPPRGVARDDVDLDAGWTIA